MRNSLDAIGQLKNYFFVQWHTKVHGLFNIKAILKDEKQWYYLNQCRRNKGVHIFPKDINSKLNEWNSNLFTSKPLSFVSAIMARRQPFIQLRILGGRSGDTNNTKLKWGLCILWTLMKETGFFDSPCLRIRVKEAEYEWKVSEPCKCSGRSISE